MIEIWEPRYRDRTVLIAKYRIPCGRDFQIRIKRGAYKGVYLVRNDVVITSAEEKMKAKSGADIAVRAVAIEKLERLEDED